MADVRCLAEVRIWDARVGALAEMSDGRVVFEFAEEFRREGLEISPLHLPLSRSGPASFPELARTSLSGLPGVFADSLPDSFGNLVIRAYYRARGQTEAAMSPLQRLLYVGRRAIGALSYHPEAGVAARAAERESLDISALVRDARRIVAGEADVAIPEIYRIGSSAGGMRPKAVVVHDPSTGRIRSGYAEKEPGEVDCLLKFDGVGDARSRAQLEQPAPFNRVEAAYAAMAREAGVAMADITLLETEGGYAHLLIRRFDVTDTGERLHQHTLGGLLHVDYNEAGASSYEEYLRAVLALGLPPAAVEQAYRRMVFNIVAVNQDDHVKNLSFHMDRQGRWSLTPGYDVTFAKGLGYTARHQMRVADRQEGITRADLLGVAQTFAVKRAPAIIDQAVDVCARWRTYARQTAVPAGTVHVIDDELVRRRATLAG